MADCLQRKQVLSNPHHQQKEALCSGYFIHNQMLTIRTKAKYLGVTISNLTYLGADVTKKAHSMGFLKRNIRSICTKSCKGNCLQDFRPTNVEYPVTTWAPFTDTDTHKIEMAQRRAARFVSNDYHHTSSI